MGILRNIFKTFLVGKRASVLFFFVIVATSSQASRLNKLKERYPNCEIQLESVFPSKKDLGLIKKKFPTKNISSFYSYYSKKCADKESHLFILSDTIRTQKQFVLFDVENHKINQVEVLKFLEPAEYKLRKSWLKMLSSLQLVEDRFSRDVDGISGATLSGVSTKFLAWQALHLHRIILSNGKK